VIVVWSITWSVLAGYLTLGLFFYTAYYLLEFRLPLWAIPTWPMWAFTLIEATEKAIEEHQEETQE